MNDDALSARALFLSNKERQRELRLAFLMLDNVRVGLWMAAANHEAIKEEALLRWREQIEEATATLRQFFVNSR